MSKFIRVPPDSTGKKIRHIEVTDLYYTSPTAILTNLTLNYGDVITGSLSGVTGKFSSVQIENNELFLYDITGEFTNNEDLLFNGSIICRFNNIQNTLFTQAHIITDHENPDNILKIDNQGSMYVRYREGEQPFDAFGYSQVSQTHVISDQVFTYIGHDSDYFTATASGGTVEQSTVQSCNKLKVSNVSGSSAYRTSYIQYPYVPGNGTFMSLSLSCGDSGKDGVVRRWGLFDEEDGVYFELDGLTFSFNVRSSVSGSVVDNSAIFEAHTIPYILEFSKFNLYWLDFQWQGVGRVRFGIFNPDGSRQILYVFENANQNSLPYMKRGSLPFRIELFNKYTTSSSSELLMACLAVSRQGANPKLVTSGEPYFYTSTDEISVGYSTHVPMLSARPNVYYNGIINRATLIPLSFEICSIGGPVRMDVIINGTMTGASFSYPTTSSVLLDNTATSLTGGILIESLFFQEGVTLREFEESIKNTLSLFPNLYQPTLTYAFKSLTPGITASVSGIIRWKEIF
jgi:hypothetical protein